MDSIKRRMRRKCGGFRGCVTEHGYGDKKRRKRSEGELEDPIVSYC